VDLTKRLPFHPSKELLEEYLFHRLPEGRVALVEEHLLICEHCQSAFLEIEAFVSGMKAAAARPAPRQFLHVSKGTELGIEAKKYLDSGDLVPATLTNRLVDDRLNDADAADGFILDGFPRSVEQAEALKDMLAARNTTLDAVLEFRVSEEELLDRLKSRGRADDTEDVIRNRMRVYREETAPLLDHYAGTVVTVDAVGEVDEVNARALAALGK